MATNKHAVIRYQALDKCFRNPGRKYFIEDLIEACNDALADHYFKGDGIKRRQLFDDINFMESERGYSAPIERNKDGKRVYYRYSDIKFSMNSQPLNESEANQLKETLLLLARFKGMPQFEWIDEMLIRLESAFKLKGHDIKAVDFEQNPYLKGLEFFSDIFNAIIYQKPVKISYQGFRQKEKLNYLIHPYFLKQYNNRWFLFGLNDERKEITNLAIDRILKISDSKIKFRKNETIDFSEYFEDVIGVSIIGTEKLHHLILEINNDLMPYIESKPLHGSQKIKEKNDTKTIVTLDLIPNYELESILFSYGDKVRVLEPASLKNKMADRVKNLYKNYWKK